MLEGAAQAFTFFTAGFESPAATVAFCLHELAFNQEIQENVYEEIDTILEKHGDITYDAINEMHYLQMVIYETLRKYTTLPHLSRACTKNVELPNFNVVIPKGTNIIIPILGIHNDPEYYPEPEKFIPERFTDVEIHARHRYVYLPFGEGPRICPGMYNKTSITETNKGTQQIIIYLELHIMRMK
ncbi:hypothetical protein M0802_012318 [Mischocyttarus mexicanus]|nr:hypothetical protein M0802_012318 [Mischocyttarus mexicanus]